MTFALIYIRLCVPNPQVQEKPGTKWVCLPPIARCCAETDCVYHCPLQAAYGPDAEEGLADVLPASIASDALLPAAARQEAEGGALLVAALTRCMRHSKGTDHQDLSSR